MLERRSKNTQLRSTRVLCSINEKSLLTRDRTTILRDKALRRRMIFTISLIERRLISSVSPSDLYESIRRLTIVRLLVIQVCSVDARKIPGMERTAGAFGSRASPLERVHSTGKILAHWIRAHLFDAACNVCRRKLLRHMDI